MEKLGKDESIVTAFAEYAVGPGWANHPIRVIIRGKDRSLREEYIQPEEQTDEMMTLYTTANAIHIAMKNAVYKVQKDK